MPSLRSAVTILTAVGVLALFRVTHQRYQLSNGLLEGTAGNTAVSLTCEKEKVVKWVPVECIKESIVIRSICKAPVLPVFKKVCSKPRGKRCVEHVRGKFVAKGRKNVCVPEGVPLCTMRDIQGAMTGLPEVTTLSVAARRGSRRVAIEGCTLAEHTPAALCEILKGKRILLAGDSVIRQVYRKLTFIMRGAMWSYNYEYRSHSDEYYAANATHDFHSYEVPEGNPIQNGVEIIFLWQPLPVNFTLGAVEGRGDIDFHLFSVGNWWSKEEEDNGLMDNWARDVNAFADRQQKGYKGILLTTSYSWKVKPEGHALFEVRMERLKKIYTSKRIEAVNFRGYSKLDWFPRYDKSHYMCATRTFHPYQIGEPELRTMKHIHEVGEHKCHDDFNANLWLMLLNGLLNKQ